MSIIYDALQKTQRNREFLRLQNGMTPRRPERRNLKRVLLVSLSVAFSLGLGAVFYSSLGPMHTATKLRASVKPLVPETVQGAHLWVSDAQRHGSQPQAPAAQPLAQPLPVPAVTPAPVLATAAPQPALPLPPEVKPATASSNLTLNGVLISNSEKIALINNQPFHVGDSIEGMKIVFIDFNAVKLQKGSQVVELRISV